MSTSASALNGDPARRRRPPHASLGVGVNLAMLGASELALANAATIDDTIRTYEKTMIPRSIETATTLEGGAEHLLSGGIPDFGDDGDDRDAQL